MVIRYYTFGQAALYVVDLQTGEKHLLEVQTPYPTAALLTKDNTFLMMGSAEGLGLNGQMGTDRVTTPDRRVVSCFDLATGAVLWENEIITSAPGIQTLQQIPGSTSILSQSGNALQVVDGKTGAILNSCDAGSGIATISAGEQYASSVLLDGYVCYYWYGGNYCYEVKCMENDVNLASVGENWYAQHTGQDHITIYRSVMGEPAWVTAFDGSSTTVSNQKVHGQLLAFQDYHNLYLFHTDTHEMIWSTPYDQQRLLGCSNDGTKLW